MFFVAALPCNCACHCRLACQQCLLLQICLSAVPCVFREEGPNCSQGGGAVLLVIKGTAHHTFTDVVPYFQARFSWLIHMVRCKTSISPLLCQRSVLGDTCRPGISTFVAPEAQLSCPKLLDLAGSCKLGAVLTFWVSVSGMLVAAGLAASFVCHGSVLCVRVACW